MLKPHFIVFSLVALCLFSPGVLGQNAGLAGSWTIDRHASTAIDPWRSIELEFNIQDNEVTLLQTVRAGRRISSNEYAMRIGEAVSVEMGWWTGNRHIGAYSNPGTKAIIQADWIDDGTVLRVESKFVLSTQQGETPVRTYSEYRLSRDGTELTLIQLRSSRNKPIVQVFRRS